VVPHPTRPVRDFGGKGNFQTGERWVCVREWTVSNLKLVKLEEVSVLNQHQHVIQGIELQLPQRVEQHNAAIEQSVSLAIY
jgi:hypothetical protein